ncbi:sensor histidine kinase [Flavonifractor hominis]|uniref:histidine kinase n=1 Tax=Flavonifractor hominis TaxID=3133178 RepID=A0ABV1EQ58_9FIRM
MKQLRTCLAAKLVAVLLVLAAGVGGFWSTVFILYQWDTLWLGTNYYTSNDYYQDVSNRAVQVRELARLLQYREWQDTLPYLDQRRLDMLVEALDAEQTNFRFAIRRNDTGTLIYTNVEGTAPLEECVHAVEQDTVIPALNADASGRDYFVWNGEKDYYLLYVVLEDETEQLITPDDAALAAQYGYTFNGYNWNYDQTRDSRITQSELVLEYGVTDPLTVHDEFWDSYLDYQQYARYLPTLAIMALVLDILTVGGLVFLLRAVGWQKGQPRPVRGWLEHIPLDVLLFGAFWAIILLLNAGDSIAYGMNVTSLTSDLLGGMCCISLAIGGCVLILSVTLATRIKTGTVWTNNLSYLILRTLFRGFRAAALSLPITGRVIVLFLLYLVGCLLSTYSILLTLLYQGFVLWCLCRWTLQWDRLRRGTARIVGGNPDFKIDTHHMYHDLARHAGQLNDLGTAISTAVEQRIQSERFKAELITNVSHDLKTPLTSIINYVDLLKKQEIQNPKALEYLDVLERKSQRLKKLTEDLVEASKASTGTLPVHLERLGMVQLLQQALGEFEEKFIASGLTLVPSFPEEEAYIMADGRHLWRVLDNLLSNCNKYALEGTRIYLDIYREAGQVFLSVKNISRQPLNIPAQRLMERFVRGEESRSTEGSGLGLSIARSLTELQGGEFRLDIDGDLFKATLSFSEVLEGQPRFQLSDQKA